MAYNTGAASTISSMSTNTSTDNIASEQGIKATSTMEPLNTKCPIPAMDALFRPLDPQPYRREIFPAPQAAIPDHHVWRTPAWFRDGKISGPCKTFTCFSKLPAEIRLKIWDYALPGPRLVIDRSYATRNELRFDSHVVESYYHPTFKVSLTFDPKPYAAIPTLLQVCAESRAETLKSYTAVGEQYMNFSKDTLWIPEQIWHNFKTAFPVVDPIPWIQSIMIETKTEANCVRALTRERALEMMRYDMFQPLYELNFFGNFPNLVECISKYPLIKEEVEQAHPLELLYSSEKDSWDGSKESEKHTNFRNFLLTTEDLDKTFECQDCVKLPPTSWTWWDKLFGHDRVDIPEGIKFKCLVGKDSWIVSERQIEPEVEESLI